MAKKLMGVVKLQLEAGKATPAPPVGPALGQYGVNIMAFVKEYNEKTSGQAGSVVPVEVTIYSDRSFTAKLLTPPAADLLRKAAGVPKGASTPGPKQKVGSVTRSQLEDIAKQKMPDLNARDVQAAANVIAGTARSMGIEIVD